MRIIIYLFILCAVPVIGFGQRSNSVVQSDDCYYYNVNWPDSLCLYWKAVTYINIDNQKALDTMRLYVEKYPFSTVAPGRTLSGLNKAGSITFDLWGSETGNSPHFWVEHYNWLVKIQPVNPERVYQKEVMLQLIGALDYIDWNAEANMLYNYSLIFGDDSSEVDLAWRTIRSIRETQERAGEDTTEFYILTFPLKPIQTAVKASEQLRNGQLFVLSNPFSDVLELKYILSNSAMVRMDVYDLLGRAVYSEGQAYKAEGEYVLTLQSKGWSSGSYYVRLSSPSGEVKTVKVVKE